ncbi:MAG: SPOR domain-containing protein [Sulfuritalea sp.]|nr:SPOR domain-containing protein [Sulfuritalea sp.]MBK8121679.1 SPOR domain-containing protein [Sulfuritalea sp.]
MAVRLIFFLLVLANLLLFAWTQGYLGEPDDSHEPQRLEQQLHPEKLRIVGPAPAVAPAPAVKRDDQACRVIDGLSLAEAEVLRTALEAAGGEARVSPIAEPPLHLVVINDLANKAAADNKAAELTRLGFEGHTVVALQDGRHEFVLGSFPSETAARAFLQNLASRGIKSARVDTREQPALKARVETRAATSKLLQQLPKLIAPFADATIGECAS